MNVFSVSVKKRGWGLLRDIQRGTACNLDLEIKKAYERYPFPYPLEKGYAQYTTDDAWRMLEGFRRANDEMLCCFGLGVDAFKGRILWDLGAGVGWRAMGFAQAGAREVHAFDVSEQAVALGVHFCNLLNITNVQFHCVSLYHLASLPQKVVEPDVIFSTGTLHHIFDLGRAGQAVAACCREGTVFYFTHSSYNSRLGFLKYVNNYLSWARGGLDFQSRLEAGQRIWKRWVHATPHAVRANHLNDLAGVFYVARSQRSIRRTFEEARFDVQVVTPATDFSRQLERWRRRLSLPSNAPGKRIVKEVLRTGVDLLRQVPIPRWVDRRMGLLTAFLFEMHPHYFKATYRGRAGDR